MAGDDGLGGGDNDGGKTAGFTVSVLTSRGTQASSRSSLGGTRSRSVGNGERNSRASWAAMLAESHGCGPGHCGRRSRRRSRGNRGGGGRWERESHGGRSRSAVSAHRRNCGPAFRDRSGRGHVGCRVCHGCSGFGTDSCRVSDRDGRESSGTDVCIGSDNHGCGSRLRGGSGCNRGNGSDDRGGHRGGSFTTDR